MLAGSYSRAAGMLAFPLAGFFAVILLWSVFVGDFGQTVRTLYVPTFQEEGDGTNANPVWQSWSRITDIFVFGDEYSNTYFNPEGAQPTNEIPFGNSDFLGGFDSGEGPKWIQYLKVMYKPDSPLRIYNYASTGAIVDRHSYENRPQGIGASSECVSLKEQVRCWIRKYAPPAWRQVDRVWKPESTIFALWLGVNDVLQAQEKALPIAADPIFASYSSSFERLYHEGARNFMIFNVPMIDRGIGDPTGKIKLDIWTFNQRLEQARLKWLRRHKDATVFLFDTHTMLSDILQEPMDFPQTTGLRDLKRFCPAYRMGAPALDFKSPECDFKRDLYFWLNAAHVTHPIHDAIAARINTDCFRTGGPRGYCK